MTFVQPQLNRMQDIGVRQHFIGPKLCARVQGAGNFTI
jgi:hypothetical protein